MEKLKKGIHGEGNKEADRQFREAESAFVHSEEGKRKISEAGNLSDDKARELEKITEKTKSRAKGKEPAVSNGRLDTHH